MRCDALGLLLHAHLDGELDAAESARVEAHLAGCPSCRAELEHLTALHTMLRANLTYHRLEAPQHAALRDQLGRAAGPPTSLGRRRVPIWRTASRRSMIGIAASLLVGIGLGSLWQKRAFSPEDAAAEDVLGAHIRALQLDHAIDVTSSDRHTVRPWFDGKVDFSPPAKDLGEQGFAVVGGRLDYVDGRTVAVIVYRRRQHLIDLFVTPAPGAVERPVSLPARDGFNLRRWAKDDFRYHAISDLNGEELDEFVRKWQAAA